MANQASVAPDSQFDGPTLLGHPRGLYVLFFAELWERFCYYGMRALLALYVVAQFGKPQEQASIRYGAFTALVYALGIFGGTIADRVLGYRRSIVVGGIVMGAGLFIMMIPNEDMFILGLATIVVGNGLFKPNISTVVGKLYRPGDARRDGGFTIFYMGINIGALLSPIACEWISRAMGPEGHPDYRYGFMLAGIGVLLGVVVFGAGGGLLQGQGKAPAGKESLLPVFQVLGGIAVVIPLAYFLLGRGEMMKYVLFGLSALMALYLVGIALKSPSELKQQMFVLLLLLGCSTLFWMSFEQAGNALNFFAEYHINALTIGSWQMPGPWFQSVNSLFIVLLGPVFAALWVWLDQRKMNPSIPAKFGIALVLVALGLAFLMAGFSGADAAGKVSWFWLAGLYFIHTNGELCLSPVGLSAMTKLAPAKIGGMVMGAWFLSIALGNFLAAEVGSDIGRLRDAAADPLAKLQVHSQVFLPVVYLALSVGIAMFVLSRWINKWMHGVK